MKPHATLVLLIKNNKIGLAKKLRGLGKDLYNGYGGKLEENETFEQAAVRELEEESGIIIQEKDLIKRAEIDFLCPDTPEIEMFGHCYIVTNFKGEPKETEEMGECIWFEKEKIPVEQMWPADKILIPKLLEEFYKATVIFTKEGKAVKEIIFN